MKRLLAAASLALTLTACGAAGDPIAGAIGIRNVSTITGDSCTSLEANINHAGQEISFSGDKNTQRIRIQAGAPLNVNAKCTYTSTTTVEGKPVSQTKTETLFATRLIKTGGDVYITTTATPNGRRLLIAETQSATPAVIRASADSSACDKFEASINSADETAITLSTIKPQDVGYVSIATPLLINASCTNEADVTTTLTEKLSLTGNTTLSITTSTDADGNPVLTLLAQ